MRRIDNRAQFWQELVSAPDGDIDAGLILLSTTPAPGNRAWTHDEIAFVCGCSRSYIWLLEQTAIKKLRREITRRGLRTELMKLVA